jgi:hypothetical protein
MAVLCQQGGEGDSPRPEPGLSARVLQPRSWPPLDSEDVDLEPWMHDCVSAIRSSSLFVVPGPALFSDIPGNFSRPCGARFTDLAESRTLAAWVIVSASKPMCHRALPSIAAGPPPAHAGSRPTTGAFKGSHAGERPFGRAANLPSTRPRKPTVDDMGPHTWGVAKRGRRAAGG